jgi:hypothetical protein
MHVVVETPTYLKAAAAIFSETEMAEIVTMIAVNPDCGDVMQGTGGFRKVRVGRGEAGRSEGYLYPSQRTLSCLFDHGISEEREGQSEQGGAECVEGSRG